MEAKTSRELGFGEPEVGYEWDAGNTPPAAKSPGRWTVRRSELGWLVIFHSFLASLHSPDHIVDVFPPTKHGERAAKSKALKLLKERGG